MPTNHEAVAALPVGLDVEKDLLRDCIVRRTPYPLASDEDAQQLVAEDPASGAVILVLTQNGRLYPLDPLDTTTVHDGTTCLVSNDNYRYKLDDLRVPRSVLDKDLTEPPADPAIGDAYLLYGSPAGDWAEFSSGQVVVYTSRGWEGITLSIGAQIYAEDEDVFYHLDVNGDWLEGFGINALPDASVAPRKMIGSLGWLHPVVENQTTNAPPTSPVPAKGTAYIIGSSPTGGWAGNAGKVAVYEDDEGTYEIYTPEEGWRVYDKSQDADYRYTGSAWESQRGAVIASQSTGSQTSISVTNGGSGNYAQSVTSAPTTTTGFRQFDTVAQTIQTASGRRIEFTFEAVFPTAKNAIYALRRGTESTFIDWTRGFHANPNNNGYVVYKFEVTTTDAASYAYTPAIIATAGAGVETPTWARMSYKVIV